MTEITHTLVANPLDCDSLLRLYLASNCSFLRDARRSLLACLLACLPACLPVDPLRRTFDESPEDSSLEPATTYLPHENSPSSLARLTLPPSHCERGIFLGYWVTRVPQFFSNPPNFSYISIDLKFHRFFLPQILLAICIRCEFFHAIGRSRLRVEL